MVSLESVFRVIPYSQPFAPSLKPFIMCFQNSPIFWCPVLGFLTPEPLSEGSHSLVLILLVEHYSPPIKFHLAAHDFASPNQILPTCIKYLLNKPTWLSNPILVPISILLWVFSQPLHNNNPFSDLGPNPGNILSCSVSHLIPSP